MRKRRYNFPRTLPASNLLKEANLTKSCCNPSRAQAWLRQLSDGTHPSIESLASAAKLHPKVIRQALRLAFLAPKITESILQSSQPSGLSLGTIPFGLPLRWTEQQLALSATD